MCTRCVPTGRGDGGGESLWQPVPPSMGAPLLTFSGEALEGKQSVYLCKGRRGNKREACQSPAAKGPAAWRKSILAVFVATVLSCPPSFQAGVVAPVLPCSSPGGLWGKWNSLDRSHQTRLPCPALVSVLLSAPPRFNVWEGGWEAVQLFLALPLCCPHGGL